MPGRSECARAALAHAGDDSVVSDIHLNRLRRLRQSGHQQHVAGDDDDEAGAAG